ncbi:P-type ATPase [Fragilariopsis cylindrus CCMP1102]|uniref:P-type ATPase n=1 Tax=Fragilariopsis cylindrus CCMP1102 TaxID=635003 RepID=A0A1E7FRL0_9STRA|nr:P-type ATPase [Fragilariopsis cylindrus CCMP1102]|eukprot:OEU20754.1 P-type ATPase [Fragilariopsis cylindrus CCMP1102]
MDRAISNPPSNLPTHARIVPAKGRHVLVTIEYYPTLGMTFEYHRRRYVYDADNSTWTKIRCRTAFSCDFLETWAGFDSDMHLVSGQIRYGPNAFSVKQPTFTELYKAQLLSPFTVFQIFCVVLWMLDDYWQYSFFTLFMVLTFEATVVFSRIKSLSALRGMGNQPRPIWVFRLGKWVTAETTELLPGDIMSLTRIKPHYSKDNGAGNDQKKKVLSRKVEDEGGDVIPADLLVLRGSTVVNEASLTGESVPQMKEGLTEMEEGEYLSMKGKNKMNVAYAGTKMLQCKGAEELESQLGEMKSLTPSIPNPPDGGCVCFVLRTGFSSAQGKLVRMIEGSQEKVKGHEKETGLLLLFLFMFAVSSSSYVLYHGLQSDKRSKYELLLHCILIVTSVIPPELPMQMALAVNNSLMTLMKLHIFCTEPYRVPMAGKLDACLFDKTGTLTTDELVAVGVCQPSKLKTPKGKEEDDPKFLTPMSQIFDEAALVLASCHSLVYIEGETTGDPLESAPLKSMRWELSKDNGNAVPSVATENRPMGKPIAVFSESNVTRIEVLTRHHFSSKLQRMSCVIRSVTSGNHYSVIKGSPEAVGSLLGTKPEGYDEKAAYLSKEGYRVIALALRPLASKEEVTSAQDSRASCEKDMRFAGFIAFTCRVRKDTAAVLLRLKEGGMSIAMVTGDALLTAIHVAKELKNDFKSILLLEQSNGSLYWESYETGSKVEDFNASHIKMLSKDYELATTGKNLTLALESDPITKSTLGYFKVFARMTPDAKETVIECLHSVGSICLMCGDGANDVGALKGADVGVALLTGFGDLNVDKTDEESQKTVNKDATESQVTAIMSQDQLNQIRALPVTLLKMKLRSIGGGGIEASAGALAKQFDDVESGELPMVKLGDASIAAPFTSKMPSIKSCVDIVRQGRCTLVSSIQMYQILALQCLISSYSLSVLYLDGVKYGDTQMTAMGMLGSISFMSVSRSKPLDRLSSVRPLTSIFHPALFISLLGQFTIHLSTMMIAVFYAKKNLPPDHEVDLDGQFSPGILNTVVFLVSNVQQVTVFVVNLQGRPFMTGLTENRPLLWSLVCTFILTFMFASESLPGLNKYFQLVPFPTDSFRDFILQLLMFDVVGSFLFDRLMKFVFAPQILFASLKGTTIKDVFGLARTVGVIFFIMYSLLGNDEQWKDLMLEEGRFDELGLNATENITNVTEIIDNVTVVEMETVYDEF